MSEIDYITDIMNNSPIKKSAYHPNVRIIQGKYGSHKKILEEYIELVNAIETNNPVMVGVELSDLYGALEKIANDHNLSMTDLKVMSDLTKQAFTSGERQ